MSKKQAGWGGKNPRRKTVESQGTHKVETLAGKELRKPYSLMMPPSRRVRIENIVQSPMGYQSMNDFINQAVEEKLQREEPIADQMEKTYRDLLKKK